MRFCLPVLALAFLAIGCSDSTGGGEMLVDKYPNGQLKSRGYQKGVNVKTGEWTWWYKNGEKEKAGEYKNGMQVGLWTLWYENGQKMNVSNFTNGKLESSHGWHENGEKELEAEYKNGELAWSAIWHEDGSVNTSQTGIFKGGRKISDLPEEKSLWLLWVVGIGAGVGIVYFLKRKNNLNRL